MPITEEIILELYDMDTRALCFCSWPRWQRLLGDEDFFEGEIPRSKIHLKRCMDHSWERELFALEAKKIPPPRKRTSAKPLPWECSTLIKSSAESPYWAEIGTDSSYWSELLSSHPYAIQTVSFTTTPGGEWVLPLSLLEIK